MCPVLMWPVQMCPVLDVSSNVSSSDLSSSYVSSSDDPVLTVLVETRLKYIMNVMEICGYST